MDAADTDAADMGAADMGAADDASLLGELRHQARRHCDKLALAFLDRGETLSDQSTFGELYGAADIIAGNLEAAGLCGRPAVLSLPPGLDFVRAFIACLRAGVIAVPAPFPSERRSTARCTTILGAARPAAILTSRQGFEGNPLRSFEAAASGCPILDVAELKAGATFVGKAPPGETIALVQYTSGSVSNPKGVVITHRNLFSNLSMIREAFQGDPTKALVSWLPVHHDMGLIGCVLAPLFSGMSAALMSPFAFLQRPVRWLRAMERFHATTAGAPNFAYDLCARQITDAEARTLDLSAWSLAFCGSEPIRAPTFRRFADRFAASGFDPRALLACYGMAEATLLVSSTRAGSGIRATSLDATALDTTPRDTTSRDATPRDTTSRDATPRDPAPHDPTSERKVVSCGAPCRGTHVLIASTAAGGDAHAPAGRAPGGGGAHAAPAAAGEICVSGEHVSLGYWDGAAGAQHPYEDRELFVAGRRYLRTGDAGILRDGELYVVGRLSDMIIVNGANIHAEDIEATVLETSDDDGVAAAAAFGVQEEEREELVLACELKRRAELPEPQALLQKLSRAVADAHGVLPHEILLLEFGGLERTGTGKIRRGATRSRYLAGTLSGISWRSPLRRPDEALCR